jgi:AraC family transcriptional regulator of adaptative response/methylated-DNA-[protein]-cysteine methyltransferase
MDPADLDSPSAFPDARESGDYERIARAIEYLDEHRARQPALDEVARQVNLSPHHFQRLFTRWAGVSPKRFLQFLTIEHAKSRLVSDRSLLDLSLDVGLSGPGRLHELFVTLEAMSPGEYRRRAAGLAIAYGVHPTRFGPALIAATARGICGLHFIDRAAPERLLHREWPGATLRQDPDATGALAARIFGPLQRSSAPGKPLALLVKGSNFQIQVWRALLRLPPGRVASYRQIAQSIGRPLAARAVGSAIGANPVAWLIPCHRVIRESGHLSHYRWGPTRKAALLGWEAAHYAGGAPLTPPTSRDPDGKCARGASG